MLMLHYIQRQPCGDREFSSPAVVMGSNPFESIGEVVRRLPKTAGPSP